MEQVRTIIKYQLFAYISMHGFGMEGQGIAREAIQMHKD